MRNSRLLVTACVPLLLVAGFWNPPSGFTLYDSARWIDFGLDHERKAEFLAAERDLLVAAQVDHQFNPRWTLAGYYYRRGDQDKFFHWTAEALAVSHRDLGALFDLCWKLPNGCSNLWNSALPDSKPVWDEYLNFLMTSGRWPVAADTAAKIARRAETADKALLLNYCDSALSHNDKAGARTVWNQLCLRKLLPFAADQMVVNGAFESPPSARGFDWHIASPSLFDSFRSGEARFTFDGFQNERAVLLEQSLAIDASMAYRLRFEYKTNGLEADSGIHWSIGNSQSIDLNSASWNQGHLDFFGPAESLQLTYQRPAGSTTAAGSISVRNISIVVR